MKLQKMLFVLIILLASFQVCSGQEKPVVRLVDEFQKTNCEDFLARIDNLGIQLQNEPNSIAYIITFGENNQTLNNFGYEQGFKDALISLRRDKSRYVFAHGEDKDNLVTQFWIVPAGADKPQYIEGNWSYEIEPKKPFIFYNSFWQDGICPYLPRFELYSKFLTANQNLRGNVVIYEKNAKKFRQVEKKLLDDLVTNYKVQRNLIKFFFVKKDISGVEFWLVPQRKK